MKKLFLILGLVLTVTVIWGEKLATFPQLMKPGEIVLDGSDCIIADGVHIYIFSKKDFKLKKKFGKRGKGPQEFIMPPGDSVYMSVYPDYILIQSRWKITYLNREGEYIKEAAIVPFTFHIKSAGKNFVGIKWLDNTKVDKTLYWGVNLYDSNVEKIKEIHRYRNNYQPAKGFLNDLDGRVMPYTYSDKIFVPHKSIDSVTIDVFDSNANLSYTIKREYEKVKVEDSHKKEVLNYYKTYARFRDDERDKYSKMAVFPKYLPVVRQCYFSDYKIYILTYKYTKDKNELLIFDIKGKFLKKLMVPFQHYSIMLLFPCTVDNGKFYQLVENDDEVWELHAVSIE